LLLFAQAGFAFVFVAPTEQVARCRPILGVVTAEQGNWQKVRIEETPYRVYPTQHRHGPIKQVAATERVFDSEAVAKQVRMSFVAEQCKMMPTLFSAHIKPNGCGVLCIDEGGIGVRAIEDL
jgi:hypothetical protein